MCEALTERRLIKPRDVEGAMPGEYPREKIYTFCYFCPLFKP